MLGNNPSDPAISARDAMSEAESLFLSVPAGPAAVEFSADFLAAERQWNEAEAAFADAVPKTSAGAIEKLKCLKEMLRALPLDDDSLEIRHIDALIAAQRAQPGPRNARASANRRAKTQGKNRLMIDGPDQLRVIANSLCAERSIDSAQ